MPSVSDAADRPELRPRRPRWVLPVALVAAIGLIESLLTLNLIDDMTDTRGIDSTNKLERRTIMTLSAVQNAPPPAIDLGALE